MIRIYADWNSRDEQGRLLLDIAGAQWDLEAHKAELKEGLRVLLNVQDELEVVATLVHEGMWRAVPDEGTIRHPAGKKR